MLIKLTYSIDWIENTTMRFGSSLFDGITENNIRETYNTGGERIVELFFTDAKGKERSFYLTGMAYIMSDSGKTIDSIKGGVVPSGVSYDYIDSKIGYSPYKRSDETEVSTQQEEASK